MPKKQPGEKYRYIAFRVDADVPPARNDFLSSLLSRSRGTSLGDRFRITVFEPEVGILKVPHRLKDDAIEVLASVDSVRGRPCRVTTLRTSGTIKTLKEKYLPGKPSGPRD
ncbi:MAG: Rpp14/Pop5 family protein [Thermoplasmata archaeon]|jgi:RNase P/RNase MRP subunit POP5|nr:Rpp14/Pop5 family protein [Thermoplasmata archaeon]